MNFIKYEKGEGSKEGLHIPGIEGQDTETLCGLFMAGSWPIDVEGLKPECPICIRIAKGIFSRYTKKEVKSW